MNESWGRDQATFRCAQCGKKAYRSRKDARRAARTQHPEEQGLSAYRCQQVPEYWHFGHTHPGDRDRGRPVTTALETTP